MFKKIFRVLNAALEIVFSRFFIAAAITYHLVKFDWSEESKAFIFDCLHTLTWLFALALIAVIFDPELVDEMNQDKKEPKCSNDQNDK